MGGILFVYNRIVITIQVDTKITGKVSRLGESLLREGRKSTKRIRGTGDARSLALPASYDVFKLQRGRWVSKSRKRSSRGAQDSEL